MKIVALSGKQGSGKSDITRRLIHESSLLKNKNYYRRFAQPLYEMHDSCMAILRNYGQNVNSDYKNGDFLQILGTEWGRECIDKNIWVNCMYSFIKSINQNSDMFFKDNIVFIDDVRFLNELNMINSLRKDYSVFSVRIECDEQIRSGRCGLDKWRTNIFHQSEIELDHANSGFDLVLRNETEEDFEKAVKLITELALKK